MLPSIRELVRQALIDLIADHDHWLSPRYRLAIYSNILADSGNYIIQLPGDVDYSGHVMRISSASSWHVYANLAVITANFVRSIWESDSVQHEPRMSIGSWTYTSMLMEKPLPIGAREIASIAIDCAKQVISGQISHQEASSFYKSNLYDSLEAASYIMPFHVWCAGQTAIKSLEMVLSARALTFDELDQGAPNSLRELAGAHLYDSPHLAACAYSRTDMSFPDDDGIYRWSISDELSDLEISPEKSLAFWKWWLTEAIPASWAKRVIGN